MEEAIAIEHLRVKVEWLEAKLAAFAARNVGEDGIAAQRRASALAQRLVSLEHEASLPIRYLRDAHGLSSFEVDAIYLAAAPRLDASIAKLLATVQPAGPGIDSPLLFAEILVDSRRERLDHLARLDVDSNLRRGGLVVPRMTDKGVRWQTPDFLHAFLRGRRVLGDPLEGVAVRIRPDRDVALVLPEADLADLAATAGRLGRGQALPDELHRASAVSFPRGSIVAITGAQGSGKSLVARYLVAHGGASAIEVDCRTLMAAPPDAVAARIEAAFVEAAFYGEWLVFDRADALFHQPQEDLPLVDRSSLGRMGQLLRCVSRFAVTVVLTADRLEDIGETLHDRCTVKYQIPPLSSELLASVWRRNLPAPWGKWTLEDLQALAEGYPMSGRAVQTAIATAALSSPRSQRSQSKALAQAARHQTANAGNRMASRIWFKRSFEDLLLPEDLAAQVRDIIATERVRERVLVDWGLENALKKGLGQVCLFDGPPGTGKTLSAEVIASELELPMLTVSISKVVSKYIGETEKNLQRVFDDAGRSRCLLLFDEADTLFSKRTAADTAVARYANMEVGLLLQLVEGYRGLVVLTTNLKDSLDPAFNRRFSHRVTFRAPTPDIRALIWRRLLPAGHLAPDVDAAALAKDFELSGGGIRSCVLRASLRAATQGSTLSQSDLVGAAREELRSAGMLVRDSPNLGS